MHGQIDSRISSLTAQQRHAPQQKKATSFLTHHAFLSPLKNTSLSPATTLNRQAMACSRLLCLVLFLCSTLFINQSLKCAADEEDTLFQGINDYRKSLNLSVLTKNENADCLASEIADQFKNQPCTNTTGADTVPGTEPQFANYPSLLSKCHLNVSDTQDGSIMPACVPNLDPSLVLTNFTKTLYSQSLNDTKYTGAGIGSDGNWIVVILTTSTPEGSYSIYNAASLGSKISLIFQLLFLLIGSLSFL